MEACSKSGAAPIPAWFSLPSGLRSPVYRVSVQFENGEMRILGNGIGPVSAELFSLDGTKIVSWNGLSENDRIPLPLKNTSSNAMVLKVTNGKEIFRRRS